MLSQLLLHPKPMFEVEDDISIGKEKAERYHPNECGFRPKPIGNIHSSIVLKLPIASCLLKCILK